MGLCNPFQPILLSTSTYRSLTQEDCKKFRQFAVGNFLASWCAPLSTLLEDASYQFLTLGKGLRNFRNSTDKGPMVLQQFQETTENSQQKISVSTWLVLFSSNTECKRLFGIYLQIFCVWKISPNNKKWHKPQLSFTLRTHLLDL